MEDLLFKRMYLILDYWSDTGPSFIKCHKAFSDFFEYILLRDSLEFTLDLGDKVNYYNPLLKISPILSAPSLIPLPLSTKTYLNSPDLYASFHTGITKRLVLDDVGHAYC